MKNHELRKNEVSTRLIIIDQGYIRKHCLDRSFWDKSWTVFEYKKIKAVVRLYDININDDTYRLRIDCAGDWFLATFPLNREDFTDTMFNEKLVSALEFLIYDYINFREISKDPIYKGYCKMDVNLESKAIAAADAYCEEHNITDNGIIRAIEDKYKSDVPNHADEYLSNSKCNRRNDILAAFCYWFGLKARAKEYEEKIDPKFRKRQAMQYVNTLRKYKSEKAEDAD